MKVEQLSFVQRLDPDFYFVLFIFMKVVNDVVLRPKGKKNGNWCPAAKAQLEPTMHLTEFLADYVV